MPKSYGMTGAIPHTRGVPLPVGPVVHSPTPGRVSGTVSPIGAPREAPKTMVSKPGGGGYEHGGKRSLDYDQIAALYRDGKTMEQIANQVGCSPSGVARALRERRVKMRPTNAGAGRPPSLPYGRMKALYESGQTIPQVAAAVGSRADTVRNILRGMVERGEMSPLRDDRRVSKSAVKFEAIRASLASGMSMNKTAEKHHCSRETIVRAIEDGQERGLSQAS